MMKTTRIPLILALLALVPTLQGCFPVIATGVTVGALAATDRRSVGTQTEDESIEWKVQNRVSGKYGDKIHLNAVSYNRKVLITGEAATADVKAGAADIAGKVENVSGVYDELAVAPVSSFASRSTDAYVSSKVKARFIDNGQFSANHVKVYTEASVVYLLGLLTEREAKSAVQIARTTDGVRKVVNLIELISDSEARRLDNLGKQ
jgi:osmotically-inducible protein OsmY